MFQNVLGAYKESYKMTMENQRQGGSAFWSLMHQQRSFSLT